MDIPELPRRIHTLGEDPPALKSILYHTDCTKLHTALKNALHDDEYEELKDSKLGVFIKFKELGFGWASRLVHYMLGLQLNIKNKHELWSLVAPQPMRFSLLEFENLTGLNCEYIENLERPNCVVTNELASFWEKLGVDIEAGPSTEQIITALGRCEGWSRDDRKRLGYLAIFAGYIEGRKRSTPTRASLARLVMELERFENYPWGRVAFKVLMNSVKGKDITGCYTIYGFVQALQVWVYTALPKLGANYGNPIPNRPSPPILAYMGGKGRRCFKDAICRQLDDLVKSLPAVLSPAKKEIVVVNEDSPRPRKKARKEEPAEATIVPHTEAPAETHEEASEEVPTEATTTVGGMTKEDLQRCFKDLADGMREGFGMYLKEFKHLSDRVEALEKVVGITKKGKGTSSDDLPHTTSPPKPTHEPGVSTSPNTSQKILSRKSRKKKN
ncbi:hypothetical protein Bca101_018288 [Brassica carinata]